MHQCVDLCGRGYAEGQRSVMILNSDLLLVLVHYGYFIDLQNVITNL